MSTAENIRAAFAPLRDQAAEAVAPLVAQIRANRRLAIALALIPVILWGYLIMLGQEWVDAEVGRLNRAHEEAVRLEKIANDAAWTRRAREADARRVELEGRMWRIETEGLARAEFQEWLLAASRQAGIGRPQVRLDATESDAQRQSGYRALNASLSGDFTPEALQAFLAAIANEKRLVVVSSMRIQRLPLPRVDMIVIAYGLPAAAMPSGAASQPATGQPATGMPAAPGAATTAPGGTIIGQGIPPELAAKLLNAPASPPPAAAPSPPPVPAPANSGGPFAPPGGQVR